MAGSKKTIEMLQSYTAKQERSVFDSSYCQWWNGYYKCQAFIQKFFVWGGENPELFWLLHTCTMYFLFLH